MVDWSSHARDDDRVRIAILSTWHPEPVDNGRKQRTRAMIGALSQRYDVVLFSLLPLAEVGACSSRPVPDVWKQFVFSLPTYRARSPSAVIAGASLVPRSIIATWDASLAETIRQIVRETNVTMAIGTDLRTLRYLESLDDHITKVLDEPDVSFVVDDDDKGRANVINLRAHARRLKYQRLLHDASAQLDAVLVASEREAAAYRHLSGCGRVIVVENGIDDVGDDEWEPPDSHRLLYTGSPTYRPNAEAIAYFIREILPLIEASVPDVSLVVTGSCPPVLPDELRHRRVQFVGLLDHLQTAYRQSRLMVVPLLSGTGTRIKILEAQAAGMPVVSTTKGAEGLDVVSGEHLVIADDPRGFADAVVRLLQERDASMRIGARARSHVRDRYHWSVIGNRLLDVCEDLRRAHGAAATRTGS
jgi:hypothetical protein